MKYIVDIDALKDCLCLLPASSSDVGNIKLENVYIKLEKIIKMIDKFPKEKYNTEYMDTLKKLTSFSENEAWFNK